MQPKTWMVVGFAAGIVLGKVITSIEPVGAALFEVSLFFDELVAPIDDGNVDVDIEAA